uniref:Uncharacterized protein n=1 Tax=Timema poppense TaxID=170557 RepID=A0A7R9H9U5_TIMPO|nr:unnamed protein product [Timema poppensis]
MASLVLTDSSRLTYDSQHLVHGVVCRSALRKVSFPATFRALDFKTLNNISGSGTPSSSSVRSTPSHDRGYIEFCDSTFHTIRATELLPYERIEEIYLWDMECVVYNFRKGDVVAVSPRPTTPPFHQPPTPFTTPSPEYPSPEASV